MYVINYLNLLEYFCLDFPLYPPNLEWPTNALEQLSSLMTTQPERKCWDEKPPVTLAHVFVFYTYIRKIPGVSHIEKFVFEMSEATKSLIDVY